MSVDLEGTVAQMVELQSEVLGVGVSKAPGAKGELSE